MVARAHPSNVSPVRTPTRQTNGIDAAGGVKRPLKLTSMNFSTTPEDERGVNRGGQRNIGGAGLTGVGNIGGNAGDRGSSGRACLGGGGKPGAMLATLDPGGRVSPGALSYGKIVSLPAGTGSAGLMRGRLEQR